MNSFSPLALAVVRAMIQSLIAGGCGYALLKMVLVLMPRKSNGAKYIFCNAVQLLVMIAFLQPFAQLPWHRSVRVSEGSTIIVAANTAGTSVAVPAGAAGIPVVSGDTMLGRLWQYAEMHASIVLWMYTIGLAIFLLRLAAGFYLTQRLRHSGLTEADELWSNLMQQLSRRLKLRRPVRIAFSNIALAPCLVGWTKAMILIPVSLLSQLSPEQAEAIMLHELAHYRQYHPYINLGAQLALTLQFFNPFVWLIHHESRRYGEYASDDQTMTHPMRMALAEALVCIAAQRESYNPLALSLGGRKHQLYHRIQNLLQMNQNTSNLRATVITCVLAALAACGGFCQLRALPYRHVKTDSLALISREMLAADNQNFMLVDAIHDSLIHFNQRYDMKYDHSKVYLFDALLPEPYQSRYRGKFEQLPSAKRIGMWASRGDSIKRKDVMNPASDFRKYVGLQPVVKNARTVNIAPKPPVKAADAGDGKSALIVHQCIVDHFIDTLSPVLIRYQGRELSVNSRVIPARLTEKYWAMLKQHAGLIPPEDNQTGVYKIFSQGVMIPSMTQGTQKIYFPRHPDELPYMMQLPGGSVSHDARPRSALKNELAADGLADTSYTVHVVYNTKGIFVNDKALNGVQFEKYHRILTGQLAFREPSREFDLLDITF